MCNLNYKIELSGIKSVSNWRQTSGKNAIKDGEEAGLRHIAGILRSQFLPFSDQVYFTMAADTFMNIK